MLYNKTIDRAIEERLRGLAATGLAQWNIRTGVRELINLLDSKDPRGRRIGLANEVLIGLQFLNRDKGWGFDDSIIWDEYKTLPADATDEQRMAIQRKHWRAWFEANRERFPDWTPDQPLPPNEPDIDKNDE